MMSDVCTRPSIPANQAPPLWNGVSPCADAGIGPDKSGNGDLEIPVPAHWRGTHGAVLPENTIIRLRITDGEGDPIVVLGGISGDRYVINEGHNPGWWSDLVKVDGGVDCSKHPIIGFDWVTGETQDIVPISAADQADLLQFALQSVGYSRIHALVGASFGGMVTLSFARQFPNFAKRLIVLCASHRPSPMAQAWRSVQRKILEFSLANDDPETGIAIARSLAMTTYRSPLEFQERFSCEQHADSGVADYIQARGNAYVSQITAQRYASLSGAIDRHFEVPEDISIPTLLIGVASDLIVPLADMNELAGRLGGAAKLVAISSIYGHDAFLKDVPLFSSYIRDFIERDFS